MLGNNALWMEQVGKVVTCTIHIWSISGASDIPCPLKVGCLLWVREATIVPHSSQLLAKFPGFQVSSGAHYHSQILSQRPVALFS